MKKRLFISLLTVTLGVALVFVSFAVADTNGCTKCKLPKKEKSGQEAILGVTDTESEAPEKEPEWIDATATAYCPCEKCCGNWAKNRPNGIVYTASGAKAKEGVTIAADWSVYPPGTILYIEGLGERIVQDKGGAIKGQKIDVYFNKHQDALKFGRKKIKMYVVEVPK